MAVVGAVGMALAVMASQASCVCDVECEPGLLIQVLDASGVPVQQFSGEVRSNGRTMAFRCDGSFMPVSDGVSCYGSEFGLPGPAGDVQLKLVRTDAAGSFEGTVSPQTFSDVADDEPFCDVQCQTAHADVTLR